VVAEVSYDWLVLISLKRPSVLCTIATVVLD